MKLKFALANKGELDALAEPLRALYVEKNGRWQLDLDGAVDVAEFDTVNTKLTEFRDTNIRILKERDDLQTRFKDVDPVLFQTLKAEKDKLTAQGITKPDEIATIVATAVEKATNPLKDQITAIQTERNTAKQELANRDRDDKLWAIGLAAGVRETAKDDFLNRAQRVWQRNDKGDLVAMKGDTQLFSKQRGKVTEPLTPEEWATEWLIAEADHLYKSSGGGGANNQNRTTGDGARLIANDPVAIGENLEALAKGTARVSGTAAA
jgi:hypothetical protein